jgi:hypothetical protein
MSCRLARLVQIGAHSETGENDSMSEATDSSRWALALHRVTPTSVEVWAGTLFPSMALPQKARLRITDDGGTARTSAIGSDQWRRPFSKLGQRFFVVRTFGQRTP